MSTSNTPNRPTDLHTPPPTSPGNGGAALPVVCRECSTETMWHFDCLCLDCFVAQPAKPAPGILDRSPGWHNAEHLAYMRSLCHDKQILVAHRAAQVRVALRDRREERRRELQVDTFVASHPEMVTREGQRALFAGPIVERGESYWLRAEEAQAA